MDTNHPNYSDSPLGIKLPAPIPEPFTSHETNRIYLAFRVTATMLYSFIDQKEKPELVITVLRLMLRHYKDKFPARPFPDDLKVYTREKNTTILCDPDYLLVNIYKYLRLKPPEIKPIQTTDDFLNEIERIMSKVEPPKKA